MGGIHAKICQNGNESTFRQTSHAPRRHKGTKKKNVHTSKYASTTQSFLHCINIVSPYEPGHAHRPHATSASLQQSYIHTAAQYMHMHVPPSYSPRSFDAETRPRSLRCGRGGEYGEAHPHQLYIKK